MFQVSGIAPRVVFSLAVLGIVTAQSSNSAAVSPITINTASSTTSSAVQTHTILVGKADHQFQPDVTQAAVGDIIQFNFYPSNHSVVRAEYGYPCIPYEMTGKSKIGFFSGFNPVDAILDDPPTWSIRVNDTLPIFYYCSAPGSCIGKQMVGVINPNKSVSLSYQKQLAANSSYMLNPGESFPDEAASSSILAPQATATTTSSFTAATSGHDHGEHSGLSTGAVVGIVVGAVAVVALLAALFFFVGRNRLLKERVECNSTTFSTNTSQMYPSPGGMFSPSSQHDPYVTVLGHDPRSTVGSQQGGLPSYSPSGDEHSMTHSGRPGLFTEVGMYPSTMADGYVKPLSGPQIYHARLMQSRSTSRSASAGSPPPLSTSSPPSVVPPKKSPIHEMAG